MSYCQLLIFKSNTVDESIDFRNAWGGAARIWTSLFNKYVKDPRIQYDSWLSRFTKDKGESLWVLAERTDLAIYERAVNASTFDLAYIKRDHFQRFCGDLRSFIKQYPAGPNTDHLEAWAVAIEALSADVHAIGFRGTSVAENPWSKFNEEKDENDLIPLSDGFEVYDWIETKGTGVALG